MGLLHKKEEFSHVIGDFEYNWFYGWDESGFNYFLFNIGVPWKGDHGFIEIMAGSLEELDYNTEYLFNLRFEKEFVRKFNITKTSFKDMNLRSGDYGDSLVFEKQIIKRSGISPVDAREFLMKIIKKFLDMCNEYYNIID